MANIHPTARLLIRAIVLLATIAGIVLQHRMSSRLLLAIEWRRQLSLPLLDPKTTELKKQTPATPKEPITINVGFEDRPAPQMKAKFHDRRGINKNACMQYNCDWKISRCAHANEDYYSPDAMEPPCCVDILRQMNRAFDKEMHVLGLDYTVMFGTLLGLMRGGDLIPWSEDNDYLVPGPALKTITEQWNATRSGLSLVWISQYRLCVNKHFMDGKLLKWDMGDGKKQEKLYNRRIPYSDLYAGYSYMEPATTNGISTSMEQVFYAFEPWCCWPYADIWPSNRAKFGDYEVNIPSNPEDILVEYYGPNWKIPDSRHHIHGGNQYKGRKRICPSIIQKKFLK